MEIVTMNMKSWIVTSVLLAGLLVGSIANAMESKPVLTLEMAKKMAAACESLQKEVGFRPIVIAIYDDGGNLILVIHLLCAHHFSPYYLQPQPHRCDPCISLRPGAD